MQNRMKINSLNKGEINELLKTNEVGSLTTLNLDGSPYTIPVHYVHENDCIYFHGLPKGTKLDNIINDSRVSFSIFEMLGLVLPDNNEPCDTNTKYKSVCIMGTALIMDNSDRKKEILNKIVEKYTPVLTNQEIPQAMINGTAVVEIKINQITGKYY